MDSPSNAAAEAAVAASRRRAAEQLVRDQVLAEIFRDLPAPTVSSRLKGQYYQLLTSTGPVAFAASWRR